ncbi:RICIN domain-containing protein [Kitasatospora indigofera]|uniref:RICIN domain-containing protein n=1 Tax=Kitasatospora indigofera TaxID=67307 RepID=UPI0036283E8A
MTMRKAVTAFTLASTLGLMLGGAQSASATEKPTLSSLPGFASAKQLAPAGAASAANVTGAVGSRLQNYNSGSCAVVQGSNEGAVPFQYQCLNFNDQAWGYYQLGNGKNQIVNLNSGKCLAVQGASSGNHAIQTACNANFSDQVWTAHEVYKNNQWFVQFVKLGTTLALVVQGFADGNQLIQADTGDFNDQLWRTGY